MKNVDLGIVENKHDDALTAMEGRCLDLLRERGQGVNAVVK